MTFYKLNVLLIEDNPDHAQIWQAHLNEVFEGTLSCDLVTTLADGVARVKNQIYDAVLVDLRLPDSSGLETVEGLTAIDNHPPLVVLTALNDIGLGTQAVQQGAQDYLVKSEISEGLLKKSILYAIERHQRAHDLEHSNQRYAQFAQTVAHELKNPMNTLSLTMNLLQRLFRDSDNDKVNELTQRGKQTIEEMAAFTNDLLRLASVEAEQETIQEVFLGELVQAVLIGLREQIVQAEAKFDIHPLPTVPGSPIQLRHLFQNLILNALKYRSDKPVRVSIQVEEADDAWTISIADNGLGIASEDHQRIFDPLVRLHTNSEVAGTGIGLAFCKRVVEQHKGKLWVRSTPGEGSIFYFTLPKTSS